MKPLKINIFNMLRTTWPDQNPEFNLKLKILIHHRRREHEEPEEPAESDSDRRKQVWGQQKTPNPILISCWHQGGACSDGLHQNQLCCSSPAAAPAAHAGDAAAFYWTFWRPPGSFRVFSSKDKVVALFDKLVCERKWVIIANSFI